MAACKSRTRDKPDADSRNRCVAVEGELKWEGSGSKDGPKDGQHSNNIVVPRRGIGGRMDKPREGWR